MSSLVAHVHVTLSGLQSSTFVAIVVFHSFFSYRCFVAFSYFVQYGPILWLESNGLELSGECLHSGVILLFFSNKSLVRGIRFPSIFCKVLDLCLDLLNYWTFFMFIYFYCADACVSVWGNLGGMGQAGVFCLLLLYTFVYYMH